MDESMDESSSDSEGEGEGNETEQGSTSSLISEKPKTKQKRKREQPFLAKWLSMPQFADWLQRRVGIGKDRKSRPYCLLCEQVLTCSKTALTRHGNSQKHQSNKKLTTTTRSLGDMVKCPNNDEAATSMEVKLCAFIAEHNLPISISEDMVSLLSSMFPNDAPLKKVKLGKQKATNVLRQVLGFDYLQNMVTLLQSNMFSIIIDEATDRSTQKQLAIVAVFFDLEKFKLQYWLVDMIETEDGSAQGIYSKVKETFNDMNIPLANIIGYSSDTTNVMFGQYHSVSQLLKSDIPYIQLVKCSCHLIHLVSSQAGSKLPKSVEDLCRDVYAHFHRSSKRQDTYKQFQAFFDLEPHQLLSPAQTRWLSLQECVRRLLEQYNALKSYFMLASVEDPSHTNDRILASLNNRFVEAYLEFLSFQLGRLNGFNRLFQSESPLLHDLKPEVEKLIKATASDFMDIASVRRLPAQDIDPTNAELHVPLHEVYVGLGASDILQEIKPDAKQEDVDKFLTDCKNFLIECILQIQQRFDLKAEYHEVVQCLLPCNAASVMPRSLGLICKKLPYLGDILDVKKLDMEWRQQAFEEKASPAMTWGDYWKMVQATQTATGEAKYPNLMKFVGILASLPFANAAVERIFSQLKLVKSDHRCNLKSTSLVSLLQNKMAMKNGGYNAASLKPSRNLLKLASAMKSNATDEEVIKKKKDFLSKLHV